MFNKLSLKVIIFGFIFTFFSSFGQSFFLGIFNTSIRNELSITHGQFGSIYASATLLSSIVLIWVGKKIDDINISRFAFYVILLLSFSCFIFLAALRAVFRFDCRVASVFTAKTESTFSTSLAWHEGQTGVRSAFSFHGRISSSNV